MNINNQKEFTLEELAQYDGNNQKPAYVAIDGIVYDMSAVAVWSEGSHFGLKAGQDLTDKFKQCHGVNVDNLKKLPQVGILVKKTI